MINAGECWQHEARRVQDERIALIEKVLRSHARGIRGSRSAVAAGRQTEIPDREEQYTELYRSREEFADLNNPALTLSRASSPHGGAEAEPFSSSVATHCNPDVAVRRNAMVWLGFVNELCREDDGKQPITKKRPQRAACEESCARPNFRAQRTAVDLDPRVREQSRRTSANDTERRAKVRQESRAKV